MGEERVVEGDEGVADVFGLGLISHCLNYVICASYAGLLAWSIHRPQSVGRFAWRAVSGCGIDGLAGARHDAGECGD